MQIIVHSYPSAQANLAYEEWLFQRFEAPVLRIWTNPQSVVVGKHQNAMAEANVPYCMEEHIPIVRRISGGGTVYHDPGNVNFSFFRPVDADKMIDYERNLKHIQTALHALDYPVEMNARHDLFLNGHKVSGNAQHLRRGRALHHGTILYSAQREALSKSIRRGSGTYIDKSVKSVRSPIANLQEHRSLGKTEAFVEALVNVLKQQGMNTTTALTPETSELEALISTRYSEEAWNFGYSPSFTLYRKTASYTVNASIERGGIISSFELTGSGMIPTGQPALFFPSLIVQWIDEQVQLTPSLREDLKETLL